MLFDVALRRLIGVVVGMEVVTMRHVGMMSGLNVIAGSVMLGGAPVMGSGVLVMFGGLAVVLSGFFRHRR